MKNLLILSALLLLPSLSLADGILLPDPWVPIAIKYHRVTVEIEEQVATTHIDQVFRNESRQDNVEGTYVFPVPKGASMSAFTMHVDGEPLNAEILEANEARKIYEDIVRQQRDPALLEYAGQNTWRARIFPFEAGGEKRVELSYDEIIGRENGLCRYLYPLNTEKFSSKPLEDVSVTVRLSASRPIKSIYSPSHEISVEREDETHATVIYAEENAKPDRDFVLYYTLSDEDIGLNLLTYRDPDQDGFYLLLASPKVEVDPSDVVRKRVLFTLDTSGSMLGDKFQQAREALRYVLRNLNERDQFNVVHYATAVSAFSETPLDATEENVASAVQYVDKLTVGGGTNIFRAVQQALAFASEDEWTNMILFLTDGKPTVEVTDHAEILQRARDANQGDARIFVFGVGYNVNTHLLDRLSSEHHGASDYVLPEEDIEAEVSSFYNKISMPVLSDLNLRFDHISIADVYPPELPDMFQGSQIVQLGRFEGAGDATIVLSGEVNSTPHQFAYEAAFPSESTAHEFLPRLWATRKIGYLLDQIRLNGTNQELVDAIIALSRKYGVITPYTSFLILEDEPIGNGTFDALTKNEEGADAVFASEAVRGYGGAQTSNQVQSEGVKYVGTKTFFLRDGFWQDSAAEEAPTLDVPYGDEAYFALLSNHPGLGRYLSIGKNVIVRFGDRTYRIGEGVTEVQEEQKEQSTPGAFRLMPNYPNPFNASTVIRFSLTQPASVRLGVYDLLGQRVRNLVKAEMESGDHRVVWDGRNEAGQDVSSGVYLIRLIGDRGGMQVRKMVLLR